MTTDQKPYSALITDEEIDAGIELLETTKAQPDQWVKGMTRPKLLRLLVEVRESRGILEAYRTNHNAMRQMRMNAEQFLKRLSRAIKDASDRMAGYLPKSAKAGKG